MLGLYEASNVSFHVVYIPDQKAFFCVIHFFRLNEKASMLSNYEVFQLLQETENQTKGGNPKKRQAKHLVNLSTICYEVSLSREVQDVLPKVIVRRVVESLAKKRRIR